MNSKILNPSQKRKRGLAKNLVRNFLLWVFSVLMTVHAAGENKAAKELFFIAVSGMIHGDGTIKSLKIEEKKTGKVSPEVKGGKFSIEVLNEMGKVIAKNSVKVDIILIEAPGLTGNEFIDSGKGDIIPKDFKLTFQLKDEPHSLKFYLHDKLIKTEKLK